MLTLNETDKQFMLKVQVKFKKETGNNRRRIINLLLKTVVPLNCSYWDKEGEIEHGLATIVKKIPMKQNEKELAEELIQALRQNKHVDQCIVMYCDAHPLYTWSIPGAAYGSLVNQNMSLSTQP